MINKRKTYFFNLWAENSEEEEEEQEVVTEAEEHQEEEEHLEEDVVELNLELLKHLLFHMQDYQESLLLKDNKKHLLQKIWYQENQSIMKKELLLKTNKLERKLNIEFGIHFVLRLQPVLLVVLVILTLDLEEKFYI